MSLIAFALAISAQSALASDTFGTQARAACTGSSGSRPGVEGIRVQSFGASGTDLPYLRIRDTKSGGWMRAYYDPASRRIAWARAACLGAEIRLINEETGNIWPNGRWFSVTFTTKTDYVPPRSETEHRWNILTQADGSLSVSSQYVVVVVMPHEQVHAIQKRAGAQTPRWFHEGHAEWIGRKVAAIIAPAQARSNNLDYAGALQSSAEPVALGRWGGVSVKREAILRQVSVEDRRKMESDPHYAPAGPFAFGPDDMTSDESNMKARYEASWRVFRDLEVAHGASAVRAWANGLTAKPGPVAQDRIVESARASLHEDLTAQLD